LVPLICGTRDAKQRECDVESELRAARAGAQTSERNAPKGLIWLCAGVQKSRRSSQRIALRASNCVIALQSATLGKGLPDDSP
jgi:hypothetical protein